MPMRGELARPALRGHWRGNETDAAWRQIWSALNFLDSGTAIVSGVGLSVTILSMLLFPVSAVEIAAVITQAW